MVGLRWRLSLAATLALAVACGATSPVGQTRFVVREPVWRVNDRKPVEQPAQRPFPRLLYFFDAFVYHRIVDSLALEAPRHARSVNSLDEVPNSTWFTNRISARSLTAAEIARGPTTGGGPQAPFTITGTKVGGRSVGFLMTDARGERYILKFDEKAVPIMETGAAVVVQRLLWALGYNVPEENILQLHRDDLTLAPDARVTDTFGNDRPMTSRDLQKSLAKVDRTADGRYRALASKFISGVPLGGFPQSGVRGDDQNDTIAHQHRREVRGLYVIFGWLQATDVKVDNTLDVWARDPGDPEHRYVLHYLVDFGKSLGANSSIPRYAPDGHAPRVSVGTSLLSLLSLGLWRRPWEGTRQPAIAGVGRIDVDHFAPAGYSPQQPYRPFDFVDRHDGLWAAKLIMHLEPEQLRAAVESGAYPDPRAADYLTRVLVGRQRKLARHWFRKTAPLDHFELSPPGQLCFDDLWLRYQLAARDSTTRWRLAAYDRSGAATGWTGEARLTDSPGRACVDGVRLVDGARGYTIIRIDTRRSDGSPPAVELHLARRPGGPTIIGLRRH